MNKPWFAVRKELSSRRRTFLAVMSFVLPLLVWSLFSYVPFIWHPQVEIIEPGEVDYFRTGMLVDRAVFEQEKEAMRAEGRELPTGTRTNPVYLPAPHQVATALYTAFTTEPQRRNEKWLHESLADSIQVIFWGFFLSSLIGVPLGILAGTYVAVSRLTEPFVEFFRYLPAPAFGALAVAILGIHDAPKIAIIFIGTFFQQVLVVANTTRKLDPALLEAAMTLGARNAGLLFKVVIPGIASDLYRDMRILLGWAWTYLIVAEMIGASSGITWFITQQARYKNFDNVFAAILIIGIIGLTTDLILAWLGRRLFPWQRTARA
ncbi:binding-protein-dependent transport systems inner membrane component [Thioalkalivibrio sulfidiphilus HL-EbGr7]|uniref:Binding-protein-dependent transport systems inner membrane component n=1 Tax=Thioalkalivibrio sulfidiphilus (strain HL-EbGR7) TaxID=396588 RepID=B8GQ04_THISH|nr:ABC transporter permease [Thioalkalivibrio sulfidiphilus]ACL74151.1 binding-protein-dependent transport systems inner membrane component [Thioalkalivibrio sulfidiphilus HL-EbGr7]